MRTFRILVVEDDPCARLLIGRILQRVPEYTCTFASNGEVAARMVVEKNWDLLIADLHLPGMGGLQVAEIARASNPRLPILVVTAQPSIESAVQAVRTSVTDFLVKPLRADKVLEAVARALASRPRPEMRVLAIGAHPDDVEIGAGGTLAGHVAQGHELTIVTASPGHVGGDAAERAVEAKEAAARLGARLILGDLEDTRIPDHGPTITLIETAVKEIQPDVIYVHSSHDVHQDHRAVHAATLVAARRVPRVLAYQSPSATIEFRPTMFVPIEQTLEAKLAAIAEFRSQTSTRDYLDTEMLTATSRYWGRFAHAKYAEPFEVVRDSLEFSRVPA